MAIEGKVKQPLQDPLQSPKALMTFLPNTNKGKILVCCPSDNYGSLSSFQS
jgi:hypothetical protein